MNKKTPPAPTTATSPTPPPCLYPNAAGIDIGATSHYVAVPVDRDSPSVRTFSAYTSGLQSMVDWLRRCGITTVAMESTGVYWIAAFEMLERSGFEVLLVDARSVKHVPGRKTDVCDSQWLQQVHSYGLLRAAFRPSGEICQMRALQRHRKNLVESVAMRTQHLQKALTEMNVHLHHVLSDVLGESGLKILEAILAGQRDPAYLAGLAHERVKKSKQEIQAALEGTYREEQLFIVSQCLESIRAEQLQIVVCEQKISSYLVALTKAMEAQSPILPTAPEPNQQPNLEKTPKKRGRPRGMESLFKQRQSSQLEQIFGVDLTVIPGINLQSALSLLGEIGTNMAKWRHAKAFSSWLGLCPNHKISGGRILSNSTRKVNSRAATTLRMAAQAAGRTKTALGDFYRRKRAQLGGPKAITATARKLACLVYTLIKQGKNYVAPDRTVYELKYRDTALASLKRQAAAFNCELIIPPSS